MEAKRENKSTNLNIRIEVSLMERIRECCKKMYGIAASKFIRYALIKYCDEIEGKE